MIIIVSWMFVFDHNISDKYFIFVQKVVVRIMWRKFICWKMFFAFRRVEDGEIKEDHIEAKTCFSSIIKQIM